MSNFEEFLAEQLKNDEFCREYEELKPHFTIIKAIINAYNSGITKSDLVAKISQLENGNANPSIKTLQKLAAAMGKQLKISFV